MSSSGKELSCCIPAKASGNSSMVVMSEPSGTEKSLLICEVDDVMDVALVLRPTFDLFFRSSIIRARSPGTVLLLKKDSKIFGLFLETTSGENSSSKSCSHRYFMELL